MGCAGYMSSVLPSSDLHSEFEVTSFSSGSWGWVREVFTRVLGTGGPFWWSFPSILVTGVVCCCFLVLVRVGFPSEVRSFFIWGEKGLEEFLATVALPTRVFWRSKPRFFRFFIELGAHGVGAYRGGSILRVFSFVVWLLVWGDITYAACLFARKASGLLAQLAVAYGCFATLTLPTGVRDVVEFVHPAIGSSVLF